MSVLSPHRILVASCALLLLAGCGTSKTDTSVSQDSTDSTTLATDTVDTGATGTEGSTEGSAEGAAPAATDEVKTDLAAFVAAVNESAADQDVNDLIIDTAIRKLQADGKIDPVEQARLHLSVGIIHFQEGRYQIAAMKAERVVELLKTPGPLRSKANFLWAESLSRLGSLGQAAERYEAALLEAPTEDRPDIHFAFGVCARSLGMSDRAQGHFEKVPLQHERTAMAIRNLAELALEAKSYANAGVWLARGRADYPDRFLDSWTDYALVRVAIHGGDLEEVRELRAQAQTKYPPSDGWLTLLNAEAEAYEWKVLGR